MHAGCGKKYGWIIFRHQRSRRDNSVPFGLEKFQKKLPDLVSGHNVKIVQTNSPFAKKLTNNPFSSTIQNRSFKFHSSRRLDEMEKEPATDNTFQDYLDKLKKERDEINEKLSSLYRDITNLTQGASPYRGVVSPGNAAELTALREET